MRERVRIATSDCGWQLSESLNHRTCELPEIHRPQTSCCLLLSSRSAGWDSRIVIYDLYDLADVSARAQAPPTERRANSRKTSLESFSVPDGDADESNDRLSARVLGSREHDFSVRWSALPDPPY